MIEKLEPLQGLDLSWLNKINELVDAVNKQQIQLNNHECRLLDLHSRITALDDPTYHEAPTDQYAEQCRWIGKLCKFRDCEECGWQYGILTNIIENEDYPYWMGDVEWAECQPVLEDEFKNVIYKGGDNE